jgi:hypothetical protein
VVVIRIIFWTWLAISLAIMAYRLVRRIGRRGRRLATSGVGVSTSGSAPDVVEGPPSDAPSPRVIPPAEPPEEAPAASATPGTAPVGAGPPAPSTPLTTAGVGQDPTIAEMVSGIQLPCGLAPMTGAEPKPGSRESLAFVTTGFTADAVGEAVAGELERLGFRVHPLAGGEVLATRGDAELKLAVHGHPSRVAYGGRAAFPMAPAVSVALELWRD